MLGKFRILPFFRRNNIDYWTQGYFQVYNQKEKDQRTGSDYYALSLSKPEVPIVYNVYSNELQLKGENKLKKANQNPGDKAWN